MQYFTLPGYFLDDPQGSIFFRTQICNNWQSQYKICTYVYYVYVIQRITSEGVFMIEPWFISSVNDCHLSTYIIYCLPL